MSIDGREFLAWLETERRSRSGKERDFRTGRRITREEGRRLYSLLTEEERRLEIEKYVALVTQEHRT